MIGPGARLIKRDLEMTDRGRYAEPLALLACALLVGGCALGPDYQSPELDLPAETLQVRELTAAQMREWEQWWVRFDDPVLTRLVERAGNENLDIRLQIERILEARARLGLARAEQLPSIDAQAEAMRQRSPGAAFPFDIPTSIANRFTIAGVLSYEIDLWGRLRREREATEALLEQNRYGLEAVRLNVIADVVATYFALRAAERQVQITQENVAANREIVRIEQIRFDAGLTDELVLRQAESLLELTIIELPAQRERVQMLEGALGLLVGMSPSELFQEMDFDGTELNGIVFPEDMPETLPLTLLERRPDIRAAESFLIAANARIGVAEALRLPRIGLSAAIASVAADESDLFTSDARGWNINASLFGPIFDFGRSRSRVEAARAFRDQALTQYEATVRIAFNEVRSALYSYQSTREQVEASRRALESVKRTDELSHIRFDQGLINFIDLLTARRNLFDAEIQLSRAIQGHLTATATLFKVLGGGWDGEAGTPAP